ncbi:MAG: ABC transporter ATP-binding protein [Limnochordaceae bacterium]|nr:ABC transporter ATP-binding protein [Limnochordaceae bacterium]
MAELQELRVAHLSGEYEGRRIENASFQVPAGGRLVLLGPAGAGKTALLALIAGLPSAWGTGEVRVGGQRVDGRPAWQRRIALIPADYALWPHRSVQEQIRFGLARPLPRPTGEPSLAERSGEAAALWQRWLLQLDLEPLLNRYPSELQPDERLRVALARAMLAQPVALLLDDPLARWRQEPPRVWWQMVDRLQGWLASIEIPVVIATTNAQEAVRLGQRILVVGSGRGHQCGSPQELYFEPSSIWVAQYLSPWPLNVWPATVSEELSPQPTHLRLEDGGWELPLSPAGQKAIAAWWEATGQKQRSVLVGLRAEDLAVSTDGSSAPSVWATRVVQLEQWGWTTLLGVVPTAPASPAATPPATSPPPAAEREGSPALAPAPPANLAPAAAAPSPSTRRLWVLTSRDIQLLTGSTCQITISPERVLLFDPVTEQRLAPAPS